MAVEIIYETHATTTDNEAGISTGRLPGRLSAAGRREALELGARHRDQDIAAVFTSDLYRAVETARIAFPDGRPLTGARLEDLLGAPFAWQAGWHYVVPSDWRTRPGGPSPVQR